VTTSAINGFICPSDANKNNRPMAASPGSSFAFGESNYANNLGTCLTLTGKNYDGPAFSMSPQNPQLSAPVSMATVTDGTSNTVIFSEVVRGNNTPNDGKNMVYSTSITYNFNNGQPALLPTGLLDTLASLEATCLASTTKNAFTTKGYSWIYHNCGVGGGYSHILLPNKKACHFNGVNNPPTIKEATLIGATSWHSGGVNVALLDGSVRFIKDSVSRPVWVGLATKAGGEILSADSY
jgi:prepilin-type processing-associated H-X9-DG protein